MREPARVQPISPAPVHVQPEPPRSDKPTRGAQPRGLALVFAVGLAIWLLPRPAVVDPRAWQLLAIFVATVVGIIAKPIPMGAMAVTGIAAALAAYSTIGPHPISSADHRQATAAWSALDYASNLCPVSGWPG